MKKYGIFPLITLFVSTLLLTGLALADEPPGLSNLNKTPLGLENQNKTPSGWSHGKKQGWNKNHRHGGHGHDGHGHGGPAHGGPGH